MTRKKGPRHAACTAAILLLFSREPAHAQSPSETITSVSSMAGILAACERNNAYLERIQRWLNTLPAELRKTYFETARAASVKAQFELSVFLGGPDSRWLPVSCADSKQLENARDGFMNVMAILER